MNKTKINLLVIAILVASNLTANAGLENATYTGADNGAQMVNQTNGCQFDLNAGTTNIGWDKFNVSAHEHVNYNFTAGNSVAVNQINAIGGVSTIAGQINAIGNGASTSKIILNNAAGVSFINGSVINVGAMSINSDKPISVQGLTVKNGNLDINSVNGRIDVKGLVYDHKGNLTIRGTKQIAIGGIKNADTVDVQSTGGSIYVKAEDYKVGNKVVSGITSEYIKLATPKNGEVNIEGSKIVVGKDFLVLTGGRFVDSPAAAAAGESVGQIVTKNGTFYCVGWGGTGSSTISNATIKSDNGTLKIVAGKLNVDNSSIADMTATSNNFKVNNSYVGKLSIAVDGTKKNNTPTTITGSKIGEMEMEYSTLSVENSTISKFNSIEVEINKIAHSTVNLVDGSVVLGTVNITDNSNVVANGTTFKGAIEQVGGKVALNNSSANLIHSTTSKSYPEGTLELVNSNVKNLSAERIYNLNITNSTFANAVNVSTNWLRLNNSNITLAANSQIFNSIIMKNSDLTASNLKVSNCIDAENGSLNLTDSRISHNLILNDTDFALTNTKVAMNAFITKNNTNNDITAAEANSLLAALSNSSDLYIGYTPDMGDYKGQPKSMASTYTGNVDLAGNLLNKGVQIATAGDVNVNASNVKSLNIEKSANTTINYNGILKLDTVVAQNAIEITADAIANSKLAVGTINSNSNTVTLNIANGINELGYGIDTNAREYNIISSNGIFNIYNRVPTPVQPTGAQASPAIALDTATQNYVNTLTVNNSTYIMDVVPEQSLAAEFGRNVKSLAADDMTPVQTPSLSALENGFRVERAFIPALRK